MAEVQTRAQQDPTTKERALSMLFELIQLAGEVAVVHHEYTGKAMPDDVYQAFSDKRDRRIPDLRNRLLAMITGEAPPSMSLGEFFKEAERIGLTADALAAQLSTRPEFADCVQPSANAAATSVPEVLDAPSADEVRRDALVKIGQAAFAVGWRDGDLAEFVAEKLHGNSAVSALTALCRERDGWMHAAEQLRRQLRFAHSDLDLMRAHQDKDVWFWQGDGYDSLKTMVSSMVVAIHAGDLRALLARTNNNPSAAAA